MINDFQNVFQLFKIQSEQVQKDLSQNIPLKLSNSSCIKLVNDYLISQYDGALFIYQKANQQLQEIYKIKIAHQLICQQANLKLITIESNQLFLISWLAAQVQIQEIQQNLQQNSFLINNFILRKFKFFINLSQYLNSIY
ncbi:hypothetical protein ABPG72_013614 [Tetrahymena utriculariae]